MTRPYLPEEVEQRVRAVAKQRCAYCLSPQHLVMARLEIEHIIPLAQGGSNDESNLWLACPLCNRYKCDKSTTIDLVTGTQVPLFNPRIQMWNEHFRGRLASSTRLTHHEHPRHRRRRYRRIHRR